MNAVVLDASALLAMLNEEIGGAKVAEAIDSAWISTVNYAEVVSYFIRRGMSEQELGVVLDPLPVTIVPADKTLAEIAGGPACRYRQGRALPGRSLLPRARAA